MLRYPISLKSRLENYFPFLRPNGASASLNEPFVRSIFPQDMTTAFTQRQAATPRRAGEGVSAWLFAAS